MADHPEKVHKLCDHKVRSIASDISGLVSSCKLTSSLLNMLESSVKIVKP